MSSGRSGIKWGDWLWSDDYQLYQRHGTGRRGVHLEEFCDADGNPVTIPQHDVSSIEQGLAATTLSEEPLSTAPEPGGYDYGTALGAGYEQTPSSGYAADPRFSTSPPKSKTTHPQSSKHGGGYTKQSKTSTHKPTSKGRGTQPLTDPFYSSSSPGGLPTPEQSPQYSAYPSHIQHVEEAPTFDPTSADSRYGTTQQAYPLEGISAGGQGWTQSTYEQGHSQTPHQKTKGAKPSKHGSHDPYGGQARRQDQFPTAVPVIASTPGAYASGYDDSGYGQSAPTQPAAPEKTATTELDAAYQAAAPETEYPSASPYAPAEDSWYGQDTTGAYEGSYPGSYSTSDPYSTYSSGYPPTGEEDRSRTPTQRPLRQEIPRGPRQGGDPRGGFSQSGEKDELDNRFVVEPSWKFETGKVFKILWPEPIGAQATSSENKIQSNQFGDQFYICFRRFIVAKSDEGHSTCVPILTYEGRACTKRGIKPDKHGIVYALGSRPQKLKNEPDLGFPPVRMSLEVEGEKLAHTSRVNYSKFQTIEHNAKVFFIGRLVQSDLEIFMDGIESCWTRKNRGRHHRHR